MDELRMVGDDIYFDEFRIGSLNCVPMGMRIKLYRAIASYDRDRLSKERCRGYNEGRAASEDDHERGYLDGLKAAYLR